MQWYWLPEYAPRFLEGLWLTVQLLGISVFFGMCLAIPIGLVQVTGPRPLTWAARAFCTVIRGTPLLIQLWLVYYGLGSLFPSVPGIRESFLWPVLREAFPYAIFAFTISVAGYEGEVMRGAFRGVPKGERLAAAGHSKHVSDARGRIGPHAQVDAASRHHHHFRGLWGEHHRAPGNLPHLRTASVRRRHLYLPDRSHRNAVPMGREPHPAGVGGVSRTALHVP
jgi:His/Glu/Gln/Arg/opine family amino acid ABC transporter permease subunit